VIRSDHVESENDDVDWCRRGDGAGPNDRLVPPFKMSGMEAVRRAYETKHIKDYRKKYPGLVIDSLRLACAKPCPKPSRECGFHVRTSDMRGSNTSNLVEWLYIEPFEQKLWFYDLDAMNKDHDAGEIWKSELLPPLPAK
jgi:hypothetical protein